MSANTQFRDKSTADPVLKRHLSDTIFHIFGVHVCLLVVTHWVGVKTSVEL